MLNWIKQIFCFHQFEIKSCQEIQRRTFVDWKKEPLVTDKTVVIRVCPKCSKLGQTELLGAHELC